MKISPSYNFKPSFGYDKKLNEELKTQLISYPDKNWAKAISDLNSYCNDVEDSLRIEEKISVDEDSKYYKYFDILINCKQLLASMVEITFKKLHFSDREYKHYMNEFKENGMNESDWRMSVCNELTEWVSVNLIDSCFDSDVDDVPYDDDLKEDDVIEDDFCDDDGKIKNQSGTNKKADGKFKVSMLEEFKKDKNSPNGFADVAGMEELKRNLSEGVVELIKSPEQAQLDFEEYGKVIPNGILLYGPPGCGKTYITKALASEIDTPMYLLNLSKIGSKYINSTSKNLKHAFDEAIKIAEQTGKTCLLFMDEVDSLGFNRDSGMDPDDLKQVATLLQSMDNAKESKVFIIAATNKYNLMDPAIIRRFDEHVFVDTPDEKARIDLLKKFLSSVKKGSVLANSDEDLNIIQSKLKGFSSDSICKISRAAAINALHRDRADIALCDFDKAIAETSEDKPDSKSYMSKQNISKNAKVGF